MLISFRKQDDVSGVLREAALSLKRAEADAPEDFNLFMFGFTSPLHVHSFTEEDVEAVKGMNGIALLFFQEQLDVEYFHELSPIQKLFVQGVEDQLARHVVYVGCPREGGHWWIPVPPHIEDRWLSDEDADIVKRTEEIRQQLANGAVPGSDIGNETLPVQGTEGVIHGLE